MHNLFFPKAANAKPKSAPLYEVELEGITNKCGGGWYQINKLLCILSVTISSFNTEQLFLSFFKFYLREQQLLGIQTMMQSCQSGVVFTKYTQKEIYQTVWF